MMAKKKFYAVRVGRKPGVYLTWDDCKKQTDGYGGAQYKSFPTRAEADDFVAGKASTAKPKRTTTRTASTAMTTGPVDITVYTDGGNRNTGNVQGGQVKPTDKSAWAYQIEWGQQTLTGTSGEWGATNNRMEVMALIQALDRLTQLNQTDAKILVVTDSKYVLNPIQQHWLAGWQKRGWRRASGELVNAELWKVVAAQLQNFPHLDFKWVKGHANTSGNNLVDGLLNQTMDQMKPGQPIPDHHTTAAMPDRTSQAATVDLVKGHSTRPKSTATEKQAPVSAAPTPKKRPVSKQQTEHSVSAMESIVSDWKNDLS